MKYVLMLASGIGEWVSAYIFFALAFLTATVGVTLLGAWVLRGDARNRRQHIVPLHEQETIEDNE